MRFKDTFKILAIAAISLFAAACQTDAGGGSKEPEDICVGWADASCAALEDCCTDAQSFDAFECTTALSGACLDGIGIELIHAGAVVFDGAAAKTCFVPVTECSLQVASTPAREEACANMLTGFRPAGAGCDSAYQCERPKSGHAECYRGFGDGYWGVCATVVPSGNNKCGFDADTFVMSDCPAGSYCSVTASTKQPDDVVPSDYLYEFEADCLPYIAAGELCIAVDGYDFKLLPCAEGLFCDIDPGAPEQSKCAPRVPVGGACTGYLDDECVDGAWCSYGTQTCETDAGGEGLFCYAPLTCGDGVCAADEDPYACPEDCGYCGDYTCSYDEDPYSCPEDCGGYCGDYTCSYDEDPYSCPEDCGGYCGDDYCDEGYGGEDPVWCPEDCPGYCGDGYCTPGEEGSCEADCGAAACMPCGLFVTNGTSLDQLCTGASTDLYWAFADCVCSGACEPDCSSSCQGEGPTSACTTCITDENSGCGNAFNGCMNDI